MLNGEMFKVKDGFTVIIPTATYYTADGYKIDQQGVSPDVDVKKEDARNYVMQHYVNSQL